MVVGVASRRRRRVTFLSVFVATLAAILAATVFAAVPSRAQTAPLVELERRQVGRLVELRMRSAALGGETRVRVLVPPGWDADPTARFPVLLLLHGSGEDHATWTDQGDAAARTAASPFLVVMPDAGRAGWYTDWPDRGWPAGPRWETHHIRELLPWVESAFRGDGRRTVAGFSMGGFGALSYAARHPGLFDAVASFSGALDLPFLSPASEAVMAAFFLAPNGHRLEDVWGDQSVGTLGLRSHNPADLVANLSNTPTTVRWGMGDGPDALFNIDRAAGEFFVGLLNESFAQRAAVHAPNVRLERRPGNHSIRYWADDLTAVLPEFERIVRGPRPLPAAVDAVSSARRFGAWGWQVDVVDRPVNEFVELRRATTDGFVLKGSGRMRVRSAPAFCAGRAYDVRAQRVRPPAAPVVTTARVAADASGRLAVDVDLGPAHALEDWSWPVWLMRLAFGDDYLETASVELRPTTSAPCTT
jgi:diacylglycerol O-acyltransferase/trehalose O-mycolyltransferase